MPTMPQVEQPVFMSTEPRPVQVDAELNLEPLYFNSEHPVTFLMLGDSLSAFMNTLDGVELMLETIAVDKVKPQILMIKLALSHMRSLVNTLYPEKPKSGRQCMYNRDTDPPSYQTYEQWTEKARASAKAHQEVARRGPANAC